MVRTNVDSAEATQVSSPANVETKLEVVVIPVADVDRAKSFYQGLGWRVDADIVAGDVFRGVQVTPPGSQASIIFGKGVTTASPGSLQGMLLIVDDIEAARAQLLERGANVSEVFHQGAFFGTLPRAAGPDPDHRSYFTYASFTDPDGNGWLLQEVKTRLPGRVTATRPEGVDVATLTELLREAETRHGQYSATAPKHHWSDWYAAYIVAREHARTPEEAAKDAALSMSTAPATAA
jgi:catechol 2,3-dioxygenase-like lactoylglutathione lyase family enzyme